MRKNIFLLLFTCFITLFSIAQQNKPEVKLKDLYGLIGCWEGTLTYLDYTSNKPYTMPAQFIVNDFRQSKIIGCKMMYPDEPKANSLDTIIVANGGRTLNGDTIIAKNKTAGDNLEIITESLAVDGNDSKPATIRHTYLISTESYIVKKEVRFAGQTTWLLRNEYRFKRKKPCI